MPNTNLIFTTYLKQIIYISEFNKHILSTYYIPHVFSMLQYMETELVGETVRDSVGDRYVLYPACLWVTRTYALGRIRWLRIYTFQCV